MFLFRAGSGIVKLYAYTHVGVNVSTYIYHNWVNNFGAEMFDHIFAVTFKAKFLCIVLLLRNSLCSLD